MPRSKPRKRKTEAPREEKNSSTSEEERSPRRRFGEILEGDEPVSTSPLETPRPSKAEPFETPTAARERERREAEAGHPGEGVDYVTIYSVEEPLLSQDQYYPHKELAAAAAQGGRVNEKRVPLTPEGIANALNAAMMDI